MEERTAFALKQVEPVVGATFAIGSTTGCSQNNYDKYHIVISNLSGFYEIYRVF